MKLATSDKTLVDVIPEACRKASRHFQVNKLSISLVLVFIPSTFENVNKDSMERVVPTIKRTFAMLNLMTTDTIIYGCTTSNDDLSVSIAHFPESPSGANRITVKEFESTESFSLDWSQQQWHDALGMKYSTKNAAMLIFYHTEFADGMRDLLQGLDFAYPGIRKVGAQIGTVNPLHESYVFSNEQRLKSGASVLCLSCDPAEMQVDISVAQGVRNIGYIMEVVEVKESGSEITKVKELGTSSEATAAPMLLLDMWTRMDTVSLEDSRLASKYLLVGTEVKGMQTSLKEAAAFKKNVTDNDVEDRHKEVVMISRKIVGFNEATKSVAVDVGDRPIRLGTRIQFQIRDEEGARKELMNMFDKLILESGSKAMEGFSIRAGILMTDVERGELLHGELAKDLDSDMYRERLSFAIPIAVHKSQGQIGPLPSGGLLPPVDDETGVGESYMLSASALYLSFYGRGPESSNLDAGQS